MEKQEQQRYIKGFNNGYLLAKHEPDLAKQLIAQQNDQNPYFKGLVAGKGQFDKEAREWAKSYSQGSPERDDREQDKER